MGGYMKYVFILNSFGQLDTKDTYNRIKGVCETLKLDYIIEVNSNNKSTEDILKQYQSTNYIIYAVGGDGMLNKVLNGIVNTNNILSVIPTGTGNDFYKTSCEILNHGINDIDVVKINGKYFLNVACFGIDAKIGNDDRFVHSRFIPKSQRYNMAIIANFLEYKGIKARVLIDNELISKEFSTIVVANARYYGGGKKIAPYAIPYGRLLDVYLIEKMNKLKMMQIMASIKSGKHEEFKEVKRIKTKDLMIELVKPEIILANIDGEMLIDYRFNIEIKDTIKYYHDEELVKKILKK